MHNTRLQHEEKGRINKANSLALPYTPFLYPSLLNFCCLIIGITKETQKSQREAFNDCEEREESSFLGAPIIGETTTVSYFGISLVYVLDLLADLSFSRKKKEERLMILRLRTPPSSFLPIV